MKIALVHSFYRAEIPSGENIAVLSQMEALRSTGCEVKLFSAETDLLKNKNTYKVNSFARTAFGYGSFPIKKLLDFKPDIVHVHNLFPNFGHSWMESLEIPIVLTLHNFRTICANGSLYRNDSFCDLCPTKGSHHSLINRCYRNSTVSTLALAIANRDSGNKSGPLNNATKIVVLSERAQRLLDKYVKPEISRKVQVLENFYKPPKDPQPLEKFNNDWIFAGRLTNEKGLIELIKGWPQELNLSIIGAGDLEREVKDEIINRINISFLGVMTPDDVYRALYASKKLVFASKWPEGLPTVFLQALAAGAVTVSTRDNSVGDLVSKHSLGTTVESPELIGNACLEIESSGTNSEKKSLELFEGRFDEEAWKDSITSLYLDILQKKRYLNKNIFRNKINK